MFVLVDAWRQSFQDVPTRIGDGTPEGWAVERLRYSYIRTAQAVLNTSFTTAMAFSATAVSPIMPISTFGVFGAICIVMNYFFTVTLTPAAIIIGEYRVLLKRRTMQGDLDLAREYESTGKKNENTEEEAQELDRTWDRKLLERYITAISYKPVALVLVLVLGTYTGLSAYWASRLQAPDEQEQWLPDRCVRPPHPLQHRTRTPAPGRGLSMRSMKSKSSRGWSRRATSAASACLRQKLPCLTPVLCRVWKSLPLDHPTASMFAAGTCFSGPSTCRIVTFQTMKTTTLNSTWCGASKASTAATTTLTIR